MHQGLFYSVVGPSGGRLDPHNKSASASANPNHDDQVAFKGALTRAALRVSWLTDDHDRHRGALPLRNKFIHPCDPQFNRGGQSSDSGPILSAASQIDFGRSGFRISILPRATLESLAHQNPILWQAILATRVTCSPRDLS